LLINIEIAVVSVCTILCYIKEGCGLLTHCKMICAALLGLYALHCSVDPCSIMWMVFAALLT